MLTTPALNDIGRKIGEDAATRWIGFGISCSDGPPDPKIALKLVMEWRESEEKSIIYKEVRRLLLQIAIPVALYRAKRNAQFQQSDQEIEYDVIQAVLYSAIRRLKEIAGVEHFPEIAIDDPPLL
jgi:hypothetical protein